MIKYGRLIPIMAVLILASCKTKHKVITSKSSSKTYTTKRTVPQIRKQPIRKADPQPNVVTESTSVAKEVIRKALSFKGTKYKYGGTTRSGMDCSGLMYSSFKVVDVILPRTSFEQSKEGINISVDNTLEGDLVFFKTNGKSRINHVGLVVSIDDANIKFVHSSSSRGVMISSLKESYWSNAYSETRRLVDVVISNNDVIVDKAPESNKIYVVKNGDTLYAIAKRYNNISVNDIMTFNNLNSTSLSPGMQLQIPNNL